MKNLKKVFISMLLITITLSLLIVAMPMSIAATKDTGYYFSLNRGPRIKEIKKDGEGVTLKLKDGNGVSSIKVYKTVDGKETRTTKNVDTKVKDSHMTLQIVKKAIGDSNKFKIDLKDKTSNKSRFYVTVQKDGEEFKINRSPKITEEVGFEKNKYETKDSAKEKSYATFKIRDGEKSIKSIRIFDGEKEVIKVEDVKKGEEKVVLASDYCKIYTKAGEDFVRLDICTKGFTIKDSKINVKLKVTDNQNQTTTENMLIKLKGNSKEKEDTSKKDEDTSKKEAQIGNKKYTKLEEAIKAVAKNDKQVTIKLLKDISCDKKIMIEKDKNILVNLNSYSIKTKKQRVFENSGKLEIRGKGKIECEDKQVSVVYNNKGATTTLKGGTYSGIINHGVMNISGDTKVSSSSKKTPAIYNEKGATLNITGGTIKNTGISAIWNEATLKISKGTISSTSGYAIWNRKNLKITGGSLSSKNVNAIYNEGTANISGKVKIESLTKEYTTIYNEKGAKLKVSGATITSKSGWLIKKSPNEGLKGKKATNVKYEI